MTDAFPVYEDVAPTKEIVRKLRNGIPEAHRRSNDSRLAWLWGQRLATVQSIKMNSTDVEDVMAATLVLAATMVGYLPSIELLLQRLEGGAVTDEEVVERDSMPV